MRRKTDAIKLKTILLAAIVVGSAFIGASLIKGALTGDFALFTALQWEEGETFSSYYGVSSSFEYASATSWTTKKNVVVYDNNMVVDFQDEYETFVDNNLGEQTQSQLRGTSPFKIDVSAPYKSDSLGNPAPDFVGEIEDTIWTGETSIVYKRYYFTVAVDYSTWGRADVMDASYFQPCLVDGMVNTLFQPIYPETFGQFLAPNFVRSWIPAADVNAFVDGLRVNFVDINFKATFVEAEAGDIHVDADGNEWALQDVWSGVMAAHVGKIQNKGLINLESGLENAEDGSEDIVDTPDVTTQTYGTDMVGYQTVDPNTWVEPIAPTAVVQTPYAVNPPTGGMAVNFIRTAKDGLQTLSYAGAPQIVTARIPTVELRPNFYYVRQNTHWTLYTAYFDYETFLFIPFEVNFMIKEDKLVATEIVNGYVRNVYCRVPIVFEVLVGSEFDLIPSAGGEVVIDDPFRIGEEFEAWLEDYTAPPLEFEEVHLLSDAFFGGLADLFSNPFLILIIIAIIAVIVIVVLLRRPKQQGPQGYMMMPMAQPQVKRKLPKMQNR